jgi:hypothetical protein
MLLIYMFFFLLFYDSVSSYNKQCRILGWLANDELERVWKAEVVVYSRYYPDIRLEGQGKTTKNHQ